VGAGLALGIFLGAFTVGTLTGLLGLQNMAAYGWRAAFLMGGVFGLLAAYLRHYVRETPVFQLMQERRKIASHVSIGALLRNSKIQLVAGLAVSFMAAAVPPVLLLYPPIYMRTALHFDPAVVQNAQAFSTIALAVGSVAGGWFTDTLGAVRTYLLYAIGVVIVSYLLFMSIQTGPNHLSMWYALVGFFGGISALGYFFLVQGFPPEVRLTGVAIPYNISTALGGSLPIVVASLMPYDALAPAHIILFLTICSAIGASLLWTKRNPIGFDA
jgi:predicted MFS family arabinose efflux permease